MVVPKSYLAIYLVLLTRFYVPLDLKPRTQLSLDVSEALAGYGLPVLTARTHQRVIYANAAAGGMAVGEVDSTSAAAAEIRALLAEIEGFAS